MGRFDYMDLRGTHLDPAEHDCPEEKAERGFYARNPQAANLPNAKSNSQLLDSRSREILLRNAFQWMQNMRSLRGTELWVWVGRMTGNGSGYSMQICEELGWDYQMKITPAAQLPRSPNKPSEKPHD